MEYLETDIVLPPGFLERDIVRQVVATVVDEFRWLKLERYGSVEADARIPKGQAPLDAVMKLYEEKQRLVVGSASKDEIVLFRPDRRGSLPYLGHITWFVKPERGRDPAWREARAAQVVEVMHRVSSPYAFAAIDDDVQRKTMREARGEKGPILTYTVRTYADGLAGLFWRNFFSAPFRELFGERVDPLPVGVSREMRGGIRLVEPYPAPEDAMTDEGPRREAALIAHLGADCFYDHTRHLPPKRRPDLPPLLARE